MQWDRHAGCADLIPSHPTQASRLGEYRRGEVPMLRSTLNTGVDLRLLRRFHALRDSLTLSALVPPPHAHERRPDQLRRRLNGCVPNLLASPDHFLGRHSITASVVAMQMRENDVPEAASSGADRVDVLDRVPGVVLAVGEPYHLAHVHGHAAVKAKPVLDEEEPTEIHRRNHT